jgi:hypothetical protein
MPIAIAQFFAIALDHVWFTELKNWVEAEGFAYVKKQG